MLLRNNRYSSLTDADALSAARDDNSQCARKSLSGHVDDGLDGGEAREEKLDYGNGGVVSNGDFARIG